MYFIIYTRIRESVLLGSPNEDNQGKICTKYTISTVYLSRILRFLLLWNLNISREKGQYLDFRKIDLFDW